MPTTIRMLVELVNQNGVPADSITNTWHAKSHSIDPADDAQAFMNALMDWYGALDGFMSSAISGTLNFKCYDLEQAIPRVPIFTDSGTITPATGTMLPNELAICVSHSGTRPPGVPPGRVRGRIFFGPLDGTVLDDASGDSRIQTGVIEAIAAASAELINEGGILSFEWAVFSPTMAGGSIGEGAIADATHIVTTGFVDNAFDVIRSRGTKATARELFSG